MNQLLRIRLVRGLGRLALLALSLSPAACTFDVPDFNNQSLQGLQQNPTPSGVATAAQGLLIDARDMAAEHAQDLGIIGREALNLSVSNGTLPTYIIGPINTGVFFVIFTWRGAYQGIRDANLLLHAADAVSGFTQAEREATRGFAKTMQAYSFLHVIVERDTFGIPVDVDIPATDVAPVLDKTAVYARIDQLLDQAQVHLQNGGPSFPFRLTSGFAGFNTPSTFLMVNRAIKARTDVYSNNWSGALAALGASFLDTTAPLELGAYHIFTNNSGDETNPLFNLSYFWAHPSILSEAQQRADGTPDLRAQQKVYVGATGTLIGETSNLRFSNPSGPADRLALIRNEELILLRAEANLGLGNRSAAISDINVIRVRSGGLPTIADPFAGDLLEELLYQKRYSLWWEWGHRWADARHYGKLTELPRDQPDHKIFEVLPYESGECFARQQAAKGCTGVSGI